VTALRGLDFKIDPGESVAILGANGAGKSTLLRILAGLSRPSAGRFEAHRADSTTPLTRDRLRGEIGYVGHATLLYGDLTARENMVFASRLQGGPSDRTHVDEVLSGVGLLEVADRRSGTFSRGMAQRLSIARAVIHDPQVLLLDEPFTGLDEASAERLSNQLLALRAGGRSLILVTHDPRRAIELSERALILHRGEIRASATQTDDADPPFELAALRESLMRLANEPPTRPGSST
jgi:heme exporter protein A